MHLRSWWPLYLSFAAIFDMAKSAAFSGTPCELMRTNISETVSTSRSALSSMRPSELFRMPRSRSMRSYISSLFASALPSQ